MSAARRRSRSTEPIITVSVRGISPSRRRSTPSATKLNADSCRQTSRGTVVGVGGNRAMRGVGVGATGVGATVGLGVGAGGATTTMDTGVGVGGGGSGMGVERTCQVNVARGTTRVPAATRKGAHHRPLAATVVLHA